MELFTQRDFEVFDIGSFQKRMREIAVRIRPKLALIGEEMAPAIAGLVDQTVYVHVAKHARRTVNPPDDTWVAIGPDRRGYKKDIHFKIAVSRNCVRLLFEVGPEYYDKAEWALKWKRESSWIAEQLARTKALAWFKDEHDEEPETRLWGQSPGFVRELVQSLGRRDGQLVLGRRIDAKEVARMSPNGFRRITLGTLKPLAPLFGLHEQRGASVA